MKKTDFLKTLAAYLREHKGAVILYLVFLGLFLLVFSLYSIEAEAILYAAGLCGFAALLYAAFDFSKFYRRHRTLEAIARQICYEASALPEPDGLLLSDYDRLVRTLFAETQRLTAEAARAGRERNDYYTMWVHQIKTPIAAMRLLLQEGDAPLQSAAISAELLRIEQYAGMALSYLRLESDSTDYVIQRCPLDGIVRTAVRKYAPLFIRKKLSLELEVEEISVLTDEKWLLFVIEQILSNALKYTSSGKIRIYTRGSDLVVEDTGIGIAAEDLPRVGQKGFTGVNGRIDRRSTGLGLYLCRQALSRLSHTMTIESEPGRGTRVTLGLGTDPLTVE